MEDFWDGLKRPLTNEDRIIISVDLADFEDNLNHVAVLAEYLVEAEPMVARLSYVWQPLPGLGRVPTKEADYEFVVFGGDRLENRVSYEVRHRLPLEIMPALRDCEGELARWSRSPLRPLLDKAAGEIDRDELEEVAKGIDRSTAKLTKLEEVRSLAKSIQDKLLAMVGSAQALETVLRFSPTDTDKLIRALRIFIDGGQRNIADASLGSTNLLYFALKTLEYEQLVRDGERDHTFLAIEEPEAHLHPILQRLIFGNYLQFRGGAIRNHALHTSTIMMTTHSPHVASVTPLRDLIVLRLNATGKASEAISTVDIPLQDDEIADIERYLDANRGELMFSRGVILVEGDAEKFLFPILAHNQGYDLDELGIAVCSISGTNFYPYLMLLGPKGLNIPVAAFTDFDPGRSKKGVTKTDPLGPSRVVNEMMQALLDQDDWERLRFPDIFDMASGYGVFMNKHTFEVDLFEAGLSLEFVKAMNALGTNKRMKQRMRDWASNGGNLNVEIFLRDIDRVGKGRFAQRLASIILSSGNKKCPKYIIDGLKFIAKTCRRG
jgi:putative ATP-dependent endonuclease of OLD family